MSEVKPAHESRPQHKRGPLTPLAEILSTHFPDLKKKLRLADMDDNPMDFLEKALISTIIASIALIFITYLLLLSSMQTAIDSDLPMFLLMLIGPIIIMPIMMFIFFMLTPDSARIRREREMDYEVVFAGRHVVIALKSGMPLFDTFLGASKGYGACSKEFSRIVDQVVMGVPINQAIRDVVANNPSKYFTRLMMQMANAISSGADVGNSIESVLDQISKEQVISLKEYSSKLTPIVMFFMIFGIIVPSLGIVLATVVFSAISGGNFGFPKELLIIVFFMIALIQLLFLGIVESSRPKYLL